MISVRKVTQENIPTPAAGGGVMVAGGWAWQLFDWGLEVWGRRTKGRRGSFGMLGSGYGGGGSGYGGNEKMAYD